MLGGVSRYYHRKGLKLMAKKAELLEQAKKLKLDVSNQNTIAQIEAAIKGAAKLKPEVAEKVEKIISSNDNEVVDDKPLAKAGKRSEKHLKEVEEKIAKTERKQKHDTSAQDEQSGTKKKGPTPIVRPKIERRGKKYQEVAKLIDKTKCYSLDDALDLIVKTSPTKFDASVELHIRLGVDPRQADQNIRTTVVLPKGTGKTIRVAVFAPDTEHANAKKAGADIIGDDDFLKRLENNDINFDILITTPQYMPKLGKYARILGPKGLMPNPKSGSVTTNLVKSITEAKAGKVEYRVDKQSIVHLSIGKISFGSNDLRVNANTFFDSLKAQKPASLKGVFVKSINLTSTMGPAIKIENTIN